MVSCALTLKYRSVFDLAILFLGICFIEIFSHVGKDIYVRVFTTADFKKIFLKWKHLKTSISQGMMKQNIHAHICGLNVAIKNP